MTKSENSDISGRIILGDLAQVNEVHMNVSQNVIVITEDKLRLHLSNASKRMERKNVWIAPLGIFLAIILSFVTADFKDFFLKAATWKAVFIIAGVLSFVWFILAILQYKNAEEIDDIIEKFKKQPN